MKDNSENMLDMKAEYWWRKHIAALDRKDWTKAEEYFNNINKLYEGNDNRE
jgi:outer membrane protein assembly factor BamD (BamD/ComL family)